MATKKIHKIRALLRIAYQDKKKPITRADWQHTQGKIYAYEKVLEILGDK